MNCSEQKPEESTWQSPKFEDLPEEVQEAIMRECRIDDEEEGYDPDEHDDN